MINMTGWDLGNQTPTAAKFLFVYDRYDSKEQL